MKPNYWKISTVVAVVTIGNLVLVILEKFKVIEPRIWPGILIGVVAGIAYSYSEEHKRKNTS